MSGKILKWLGIGVLLIVLLMFASCTINMVIAEQRVAECLKERPYWGDLKCRAHILEQDFQRNPYR